MILKIKSHYYYNFMNVHDSNIYYHKNNMRIGIVIKDMSVVVIIHLEA